MVANLVKFRSIKAYSLSANQKCKVLAMFNRGRVVRLQTPHVNVQNKTNICVSSKGKQTLVSLEDIVYCQALGNYCKIILENGESITVSKTLKAIEADIKNENFHRCHQSYLVNLRFVDHIAQSKEIKLKILQEKQSLPMSRRYKQGFKNAVMNRK